MTSPGKSSGRANWSLSRKAEPGACRFRGVIPNLAALRRGWQASNTADGVTLEFDPCGLRPLGAVELPAVPLVVKATPGTVITVELAARVSPWLRGESRGPCNPALLRAPLMVQGATYPTLFLLPLALQHFAETGQGELPVEADFPTTGGLPIRREHPNVHPEHSGFDIVFAVTVLLPSDRWKVFRPVFPVARVGGIAEGFFQPSAASVFSRDIMSALRRSASCRCCSNRACSCALTSAAAASARRSRSSAGFISPPPGPSAAQASR